MNAIGTAQPSIMLLGGGYTLSRLASKLDPATFIITATSDEKVRAFQQKGFRAFRADLGDPAAFAKLLETHPGLETLIDGVPPLQDGAESLARIAHAVRNSSISRVFYLSATGVFGVEDGSWVNEETAPRPNTTRGQQRLDCEQVYRAAKIASTALRLSAIYGPGRGVSVALQRGSYRLIDDGSRWTNRIHVDDIVAVLQKLLQMPVESRLPGVLCVSDDEPALQREVVAFYREQFALPEPPAISREEAEQAGMQTFLSNQRVSNKLLKKALQLELLYRSYREGAATEFH